METNTNDVFIDSNIWTNTEILKVLSIINVMNLSKNLTLAKMSPIAVGLLSDGLLLAGYQKSIEEVETLLVSLKMSYLRSKQAAINGSNDDLCPYYELLDKLWGSCITLNLKKEKKEPNNIVSKEFEEKKEKKEQKSTVLLKKILKGKISLWSDDVTIKLLNSINTMNLVSDFRYNRLSSSSIKKLVTSLANCGYDRTCNQVICKMRTLRDDYLKCIRAGSTPQSIADCPFYNTIHEMFQQKIADNTCTLPFDHDYEKKSELSTDSMNNIAEKSNQSVSIREKIESSTDKDVTLFESPQLTQNCNITKKCHENETTVDILKGNKSNGCNNNGIDGENNLNASLNSSAICEKSELQRNNDNADFTKVNGKKTKAQSFTPDVPKFIRIIKGNSKFILKKMDTPPYVKSKPPSYKRSYSALEDSNFLRNNSSSFNLSNNTSTPIKSTMPKKLKNSSEPRVESPMPSHAPKSDSANNDVVTSEMIKTMVKEILNHQQQMQQEHHVWMEKQFEIQRNYDRAQQELLLEELRQFRKELCIVTDQLFTD